MDGSSIVTLLIVGLVVYIGCAVGIPIVTGEVKRAWQRGHDSIMLPHLARQIAKGAKPWGKPFAGSTFGGAFFLDTQQLLAQSLATPVHQHVTHVPYIGGHATEKGKNSEAANLFFPHDGHLMTVAPARAGKGVSHIIPNLLLYEGSTVVIDIKGQNAAITSEWRKRNGHQTLIFQPFGGNGTACFNPFDFIRSGSDAWDDAQLIAEMIVPPTLQADEFWDSEARNLVACIILHIAAFHNEGCHRRNLAEVRRILSLGEESFLDVIGQMLKSGERAVVRQANHYLSMEDKVKANVRTTAKNKTHFLDSKALDHAMRRSDWRFEDMKREKMSVYLVIPPDRLSVYWPLLRLMVGMATAALGRESVRPKVPVLFMLDEFPQLGRMDRLVKDMRWIAEYGVRYWIFTQDISSLQGIYNQTGTASILANCACRIFFGTSDLDTAKQVSDTAGDMTVIHEHVGVSKNSMFEKSENSAIQYSTRKLVAPEEVLHMDRSLQLVFMQGERPILSVKTPYYKDVFFGPRATGGQFETV